MRLTDKELGRAKFLQRRLKVMRLWNRVGELFTWPWTFYKEKELAYRNELEKLYVKRFKTPEPEQYFKDRLGNPLHQKASNASDVPFEFDALFKLFGSKMPEKGNQ